MEFRPAPHSPPTQLEAALEAAAQTERGRAELEREVLRLTQELADRQTPPPTDAENWLMS